MAVRQARFYSRWKRGHRETGLQREPDGLQNHRGYLLFHKVILYTFPVLLKIMWDRPLPDM